jgi:hypothetical protein
MADTPNFDDANLALRLYELRREPEMRKARTMVGDVLDGAPAETVLAIASWGHPENAHFRQVTSYWEIVASFVNRGILHPDVYLDTCGEALYTFSVLKPHLAALRERQSPRFLSQTERLVAEHAACRERVETIDRARAAYFAKEAAAAAAKAAKGGRVKAAPAAKARPARRLAKASR